MIVSLFVNIAAPTLNLKYDTLPVPMPQRIMRIRCCFLNFSHASQIDEAFQQFCCQNLYPMDVF